MGTSESSMNLNADRSRDYSGSEYAAARLANENSEEIREEIASTRDRMDETLDELGNRLNPRRLIDDAMQLFAESGSRETVAKAGESAMVFTENLGRAVRDNPVPTLLIGAGLAWLAFGNSPSDKSSTGSGRRREMPARTRPSRYDTRFAGEGMYRGRTIYDLEEDAYLHDEYVMDEYSSFDDESGLDDDAWNDLDATEFQSSDDTELSIDSIDTNTATNDSVAGRAKRAAGQVAEGASHAAKSATHAASSVGSSVSDAVASVGETVKDAAGATTAALSSAASAVGSGLASAGEAVAGAARQTLHRGQSAGSQAYRYGGRAGRGVGRGISHQQEHMSDLVQSASRRYTQASETYPLAMGMGCLAIGMLTGLLVPNTQYEDEWMGDAADELKQDLRATGQEVIERGKQAVEGTAAELAKSADEHGLSGSNLLERGERVVAKVVSAATEAVKEEHLTPNEVVENVKQVGKDATDHIRTEASHLASEASKEAGKADPDLKQAADAARKSGNQGTGTGSRS